MAVLHPYVSQLRSRVEGVQTNYQRDRGLGPCLQWEDLDKVRHIDNTALIVRVQRFRKTIHKAIEGQSSRPISSRLSLDQTVEVDVDQQVRKTTGPEAENKMATSKSFYTLHSQKHVYNGGRLPEKCSLVKKNKLPDILQVNGLQSWNECHCPRYDL